MKFSTLFLKTKNEHLTKDVGAIPYFLNKSFNYSTEIITYNNESSYSNYNQFLKHVNFTFVSKSLLGEIFDGGYYLIKQGRKIDILNLYHLSIKSFIWACVYKIINKNGFIYLKSDASFNSVYKIRKNLVKKIIMILLFKLSDIISVESKAIMTALKRVIDREYLLIPNGFFEYKNQNLLSQKEKCFLFVGRVDSPEKNVELLVDAFFNSRVEKKWTLKLVGPCSKEFKSKILNKFERLNGDKNNRLVFLGPVYDRQKLQLIYEKSAIFVLPSKYESYGIVLVEALSNGCYLISSDNVPPFKEITDNYKYGVCVDIQNKHNLENALYEASISHVNDELRIQEQIKYANRAFLWNLIVSKLNDSIKERLKNKIN